MADIDRRDGGGGRYNGGGGGGYGRKRRYGTQHCVGHGQEHGRLIRLQMMMKETDQDVTTTDHSVADMVKNRHQSVCASRS